MDTDSFYFALSHDTLEEAVKPELLEEFEREKNQWLSWDKWSNREPGLFKLEKEGTMAIALCSKCYFVDNENSGKTKISSKGVSQKQNMPPPKPGSILKQEHNEQTRAQRANLEKVRYGSGWLQGHGHKQRLQDEGRGDVHIRATQAWPQCILQQALGAGRWHPHGADRVPHSQLNKRQPRTYTQPWDAEETGSL